MQSKRSPRPPILNKNINKPIMFITNLRENVPQTLPSIPLNTITDSNTGGTVVFGVVFCGFDEVAAAFFACVAVGAVAL